MAQEHFGLLVKRDIAVAPDGLGKPSLSAKIESIQ
jgi:hypothetical protein